MARAPDERYDKAKAMFLQGNKLIDIANELGLPEGTVRRWKSTHKWSGGNERAKNERSEKKVNAQKEKYKVVADEVSQVMDNPNLTDKQQLFCLHYVKSFNATKAYQKAYGVDYVTANAHGYEMLSKVVIKNEIQRLKQNRLNREMISELDIFQKYMDIAFADITDYLEFGIKSVDVMGAFGPIEIKDPDTGEKKILKKEVNSVRFRESNQIDGTLISEVKQGKDGASIKLPDRMKALQWLTDHMDLATEEQQAKMAVLKSQVKTEVNNQVEDWKEAIVTIAKRRNEKQNE